MSATPTRLHGMQGATYVVAILEPAPGQRCSERLPLSGVTLTEEESALLPYLCLDPEDVERLEAGEAVDAVPSLLEEELPTGQGVPTGVECDTRKWCDGTACTEVCERGSVRIPTWQSQAIRLQSRLSAALPLCYSTLLGTHNSGITLADGYGNRDEVFQSYFKYVKWAVPGLVDAPLRTSDQWLSLTDQLRLGVRVVELDTHWVGGALRIAHCGGLHLPKLNMLLKGLNLALKLLGKSVKWDTETLGCSPSLSSIAVDDQRLFSDALLEIRAWMDAEENREEVLVLYFDDQPDLEAWGCVPVLLSQLADAFPHEWFYTPEDALGGSAQANNDTVPSAPPPPFPPPASPEPARAPAWPSLAEMWAKGKRLLLVSGTDYGEAMAPLIFPRGGHGVCGWWEPPLKVTHVAPACSVGDEADSRGANARATARLDRSGEEAMAALSDAPAATAVLPAASSNAPRALFNGTWARVFSCELYYGPFDCEFVWGGSNSVLDDATIPPLVDCGVNVPSPDGLTPERAAGIIWTWAPEHPRPSPPRPAPADLPAWRRWAQQVRDWLGLEDVRRAYEDPDCSLIRASDGRWESAVCAQDLPSACRAPGTSTWRLARGRGRGECDAEAGELFDVPRHPRENAALAEALREAGEERAWLALRGPDWTLEALPAFNFVPPSYVSADGAAS